MFLLTAAEMRECDRRTIEEIGVPGLVLMERAARGIRTALVEEFPGLNRRRIWIVCGKGNNGGDGLALARILHDDGLNPRVLLTDPVPEISGDAAQQVAPLRERGLPLESINPENLSQLDRLGRDDILIDAILGTGFRGAITGPKAGLVEAMNRRPAHVVAADIPSGLSADTREVAGPAIRAELTVTMAFPKRSFHFWPARGHVGRYRVVDIGVPSEVVGAVRPTARLLTAASVSRGMPALPRDAHKGIRGKVLIVGGSPGLTGAPCLAALGAARAGAGLVRVGTPRSLNPILETKLTEQMTYPLPETEAGTIGARSRDFLLSLRGDWDALVLGPGLSRHPETDRLVRDLFEAWTGPVIVDADALNALSSEGIPAVDPIRPAPVLTPHPGEMARLARLPIAEVTADPIETARKFAQKNGVVLVLKGGPTVVSDPTGNVLVNTTGNPGLATGGSGDVLSGMIGTFLAQGMDPWWAAGSAVYLHGLSADLLAERGPERAIFPSDVASGLAGALTWLTGRGESP